MTISTVAHPLNKEKKGMGLYQSLLMRGRDYDNVVTGTNQWAGSAGLIDSRLRETFELSREWTAPSNEDSGRLTPRPWICCKVLCVLAELAICWAVYSWDLWLVVCLFLVQPLPRANSSLRLAGSLSVPGPALAKS
ncbi:hypothetical protein RRG08_052116 [Elysia crispata]|uniref:Uncharacterized protein n=1 Tax=Elysia crispata TaxID=231223 RepID=A0AAE1A436_9GAST|nr:hypothetical protein RRG08_052116 [Elysia crispata]